MKIIRQTIFLFFIFTSTLIVSAGTLRAAGSCECTVGNTNTASVSAPFSQNDCSGSPEPEYTECSWGVSFENPAVDECHCNKIFVANGVQQNFSQATDPGACVAELLQNQVAPTQRVTGCAWTGEDPQQEQGQLFSSKLRSDIKGLDQFNGKSLPQVIGTIIQTIMGVMGTVALLMFIYGGLMWMLAQGNSQRQETGLKTLVWGALGVAVMLSSYALVTYVFDAFR